MTKPPETDNKQRRKLNILAIFIAAIALVGACLGSVYVWEKWDRWRWVCMAGWP